MIAEQKGAQRASSKTIERWSAHLEDLHARITHRFPRPEVRDRVHRYLLGLLADVRRKNGWQMAEAIGEARPRGVQHLLNDARWDADLVRDDLAEYVVENLGDARSGVFIIDETGFLKKGNKSVGVARQYTGSEASRQEGELPGGGLPVLLLRKGDGLHRPGTVPAARGVGGGLRPAGGGRRSRGGALRDQRRAG